MFYKILIGLAALFGIFQFFRETDKYAKAFLLGMVSAIGLTFIPNPHIVKIGFGLFILTLALLIVFGFTAKGLSKKQRTLILAMAIPIFIAHVFTFFHWPFTGPIGFTMIIPVFAYLNYTSKLKQARKFVFGPLTILFVDAIIRLTTRLEWLVY